MAQVPQRPRPIALRIELLDVAPLVWRRVSVAAVVRALGARGEFEYRYDMGDGWRHRIVVESLPPFWMNEELPLPVCVAGENACPPENIGGPAVYSIRGDST